MAFFSSLLINRFVVKSAIYRHRSTNHFQDIPNTMSISEITEKLGLKALENHLWHIQPASAISGEGIHEGLDWLCNQLKD